MVNKNKNRRLWQRIGIGIIGGIALVAVILVALPDGYVSGKVSAAASSRLGREITIGSFNINWHQHSAHLVARDIRVANAPGMEPADMIRIGEVDMTFRFWKLLTGRLEIPSLHVTKPEIYLEQTDEKTKNWDFSPVSGPGLAAEAVKPDDRHDMPLIGDVTISEGVLAYKDVPRELDMTLNIDSIKGADDKAGKTFTLQGDGNLEGRPFKLRAEAGSLNLLRDSGKDYPLMVSVSVGNTEFRIDGTFKDPIRMKGLDAILHLSGETLSDLYYFIHVAFPPTPPFTLDGQLVKEGERWTFNDFKGTVGKSDLSGTVDYTAEGERPLLTGSLYSNVLNVTDLGGFVGAEYEGGTKPHVKGARLLPDTSLDLKRLRAGDMNLTFTAKQLNAPGWPLNDMETHIALDNGFLSFSPLSFGVADGRIDGYLKLDGREDLSRVDMNLKISGMSLSRFFKGTSFDDLSKGRIHGRIDLKGDGNALSTVLGNSDGRVSFLMNGGKLSLMLVEAMDIDIAQIAPLFFGKDKSTEIRCAVGDFIVTDGLLNASTFIVDTEDTNIKGDAKINLKNEALNIDLNARPKDTSFLALQSKILVRGTMANPRVMIDPLTTGLRAGAAALFSVVTPLAAILPFIEVGQGEDANCAALLQSTKKEPTTAQKAKAKKETVKATTKKKKTKPALNP